jgi:hypothetical protein
MKTCLIDLGYVRRETRMWTISPVYYDGLGYQFYQ